LSLVDFRSFIHGLKDFPARRPEEGQKFSGRSSNFDSTQCPVHTGGLCFSIIDPEKEEEEEDRQICFESMAICCRGVGVAFGGLRGI